MVPVELPLQSAAVGVAFIIIAGDWVSVTVKVDIHPAPLFAVTVNAYVPTVRFETENGLVALVPLPDKGSVALPVLVQLQLKGPVPFEIVIATEPPVELPEHKLVIALATCILH